MKSIRDIDDLAMNGAALAFTESLPVETPNIGDRDQFLQPTAYVFNREGLANAPLTQELEKRIATCKP